MQPPGSAIHTLCILVVFSKLSFLVCQLEIIAGPTAGLGEFRKIFKPHKGLSATQAQLPVQEWLAPATIPRQKYPEQRACHSFHPVKDFFFFHLFTYLLGRQRDKYSMHWSIPQMTAIPRVWPDQSQEPIQASHMSGKDSNT